MAPEEIKKQILNFNTVFLEEEEGGYSVIVPSLPGCVSQGDTFEESVENIKEAIGLYLEGSNDEETFETKKEFIVPIAVDVRG